MNWSDYFYYDKSSPTFLRIAQDRYARGHSKRLTVAKGDVAGYIRKDGYAVVKLFVQQYKVHRIIWELHNGSLADGELIDHIDGNKSNNSIQNLRIVTNSENVKNKTKYKSNSTGVTGIHVNEKSPGSFYYVATWREGDKTIGAKAFSWKVLGKEGAFTAAVSWRESQIDRLKSEGIPYTERHGK